MLTTKNWRAAISGLALAVLASAFCAGCAPNGPRALLDGERLLREGKLPEAIAKLEQATRLLPAQAQAWNHLGLAYHMAGQPEPALKAYQQARRCDLNLTPVRYNLGCLLLEQNSPQAAAAELTAFTVLERESADGWLKLGTAHLRTREWSSAEQSFQNALRLRPNSAEAWNGLGIVQTQRKRPRDAMNSFVFALQNQPGYGPAILNLGVLYQSLNSPELAVQKYEEYLALRPAPRDSAAVAQAARQLRWELAASAQRQATAVVAAPPAAPVNDPGARVSSAQPLTNAPVRVQTNAVAPPAVASSTNLPARTLESNATQIASATTPRVPSEPPRRVDPVPQQPSAPAVSARTGSAPSRAETPAAWEVVQLPDEPPPRPAQDQRTSSDLPAETSRANQSLPLAQSDPLVIRRGDSPRKEPVREDERPPVRMNPATWFRGKRPGPVVPTPLQPAPTTPERQPDTRLAAAQVTTNSAPALPPRPANRRYAYRSSNKPAPGDRQKAEAYFTRAVDAHRDRRMAAAIEDYRQTIRLDPSFFEAQYNLGLAAYETRELPTSLSAYETALSINPTSENARYNFAIALELGGYYDDAVSELEKLVAQRPEETRAHFSLASLYAEKLFRPDLARTHYRRVLELQPHHAQAPAIRYWLAANP